jgi:hypothetical protein
MVDDNQGSTNNTVTILHQNICGLRRKTDELISSISPNFPQVLCFSEHHLKTFELDKISINGYKLGAAHSRQVLKGGGVCIFVQNTLECTNIDLDKYCKEQDTEICMLKLTSIFHNTVESRFFVFEGNGENKRKMCENEKSENPLFLTKKVVHCRLLHGRILPQFKI